MKTHQQNPDWHQLGLWEYMLLANPSEEVHWQVMEEKKYFGHKYDTDIATKTLPKAKHTKTPYSVLIHHRQYTNVIPLVPAHHLVPTGWFNAVHEKTYKCSTL